MKPIALCLLVLLLAIPAMASDTVNLLQDNKQHRLWEGVGGAGKVTLYDQDGNPLTSLGSGGPAQSLTLASGVTTDTTAPAIAGVTGTKTFWGQVVCSSGACTQTQAIYGDIDDDEANGVLVCTITLSGTTRDQNADCAGSTASYPYYYVITTNTSGTSATGAVYVLY
jgi:hypothetical protein